ncbi:MAG: hypothetical protein M3R29_00070 [Verrucomicrobiota bacterium]|nr:hypothetical protein [Verrucomicrobiota bacterium]
MRTGTNIVEARVFNDNAPPSLWLVLNTDEQTLRSDQTWQASVTGSAWRQAVLASTPRFPGPGNAVAGGETTFKALGLVWPTWIIFAGIALVVCTTGHWWLRRSQTATGGLPPHQMVVLLLVIASAWMLLFWNNAGLLRYDTGFDARPHNEYIKYVQERRTLPLPTEGFEMFQPPLYYILSAVALSSCGLSVNDASGILVLRTLTMLFGIVHFTLVFLSMRLLFPDQIGRQLAGLILAAFLPMQLYLSHYVTNETLAATLVTAALILACAY